MELSVLHALYEHLTRLVVWLLSTWRGRQSSTLQVEPFAMYSVLHCVIHMPCHDAMHMNGVDRCSDGGMPSPATFLEHAFLNPSIQTVFHALSFKF